MQAEHNTYIQYTPVMKFILGGMEKRLFNVKRMSYLGSIDDWIEIEYDKTIEELASALIQALGTDEFYKL
jgi:hypothetical protein